VDLGQRDNGWPTPLSVLNLTEPELLLWYDGSQDRDLALCVPRYEELLARIVAVRQKAYEEILSVCNAHIDGAAVDSGADALVAPLSILDPAGCVAACSTVPDVPGLMVRSDVEVAAPLNAVFDAPLDGDQAILGMFANVAGAEMTASSTSSIGDSNEEVELVVDDSGQCISPDLYKLKLPSHFCCIMKDYLHSYGLMSLFDRCISTLPRSFLSDATFSCDRWHVRRRPFIGSDCDMFWVSPSNLKLHNEVLNYLGSAGIDAVLRSIASFDSAVVRDWTIFQLLFIVVSRSNSTNFHVDFHNSLAGVAWHVMIPLVLCPCSPPELFVKSTVDDAIVPIKYEIGTALLWGALLDHSTGIFSYEVGFCVCLSVSVGSINCGNVKWFLSDISQKFPPRKSSLLLDWAKSPHFSSGTCYVPSLQHEALLGKEWLHQYNTYVKIRGCNRDVLFPPSIRKWVSHQRYCFAVKHNAISKDAYDFTSSHVRSASRTLTCFREFMLREINFPFHVERDSGINQSNWYRMYNEVREFVANHGHCKVTRGNSSKKLYSWVRTQKAKLSSGAQLSAVKRQRLRLMQELGFFKLANI
jgi:hypothetical protein